MGKVSTFLKSFVRDENGGAAGEYALILAVVTTGIAGAVIFLGEQVTTAVSGAASCIADPTVCP